MRPVTLVLTEEERGARDQEELLAMLEALAERVEALGPEAPPDVLRDALRGILEGLEAVRPRTPAIEGARKLIRMLGAQAEARSRIRNAMDRIRDFNRVQGADDEAQDALRDLLRAQADLLRSGVPVTREQVARIDEDVERFRETFGDDALLFDDAQLEALETANEQARIREGLGEVFGEVASARGDDLGALLGPRIDAGKRESAEAFLDRNIEWNRHGIALADQVFDAAIRNPEGGFAPGDLDEFEAAYGRWSTPPSETAEQLDAVVPDDEPAPAAPAAEKTARSLLKILGS